MMGGFDELIYGDGSVHKKVKGAFGVRSWSNPSQLYMFRFDLRNLYKDLT